MTEALEKFSKKMREQNIYIFMQDCGAPVQLKMSKKVGGLAKASVSVPDLKMFFGKSKRHETPRTFSLAVDLQPIKKI
jgi:hypothetical protein